MNYIKFTIYRIKFYGTPHFQEIDSRDSTFRAFKHKKKICGMIRRNITGTVTNWSDDKWIRANGQIVDLACLFCSGIFFLENKFHSPFISFGAMNQDRWFLYSAWQMPNLNGDIWILSMNFQIFPQLTCVGKCKATFYFFTASHQNECSNSSIKI